jgi:mRNA interferase MazF
MTAPKMKLLLVTGPLTFDRFLMKIGGGEKVTPDLVLQGEVRWFDFGAAVGSEPQGHRPVVIIQGDELNHSRLRTTVVAPVTTSTHLSVLPGAVFIPAAVAGLTQDSVVELWAVSTVNKWALGSVQGVVPSTVWKKIERAMGQMMGRPA